MLHSAELPLSKEFKRIIKPLINLCHCEATCRRSRYFPNMKGSKGTTTKIMASIKNTNVRQKLLAVTPFSTLLSVVDLCRSQETALKDFKELSRKKVYVERVIKTKYQ